MVIAIVSFLILLLIVLGMSVGVIMGRKPLSGSCGGVGAALGEKDYTCSICGDDPAKCEQEQGKAASKLKADGVNSKAASLGYNVGKSKKTGKTKG